MDADLYDLGVEAQKRIREAKVLVSGLSGVGVELCKNLILAGINLTIHDTREARIEDLGANFYLSEEDIGRNVS